ncbi:hypothetical protein SSX86_030137 [Deinandra increscens subsp. villosa]|uniref:Uncharacterized protein n=1 Tax=Deinandra increscens subsp. villosa TaxID=3103831 RepID=A0AAP0GKQ1_9ASTR
MMAAGKVTDLLPYEAPVPLKVRVIRKYCIQWSPTDKSQLFYLLVDESGNAVEAKISPRLKKIDSKVFLYKCYLLTGYVVDPPQKIGRVVDQTVTIIVGDRAEFHAIDELPIQKQFYSFASYSSLEGRYNPTGKTVLLTDYLCKIQRVSTVFQRSNINMLKMVVFDHSREPIEITLWEKIAFTYANLLAREKVIAISSLKVTKYLGTLQLESTSATTIIIDLAIEGYSEEIKSLKALTARASSHYGYQTEDDIRNNLTTIGDILSKNPETINNHRFSCIAKVKEIYANRKWFNRKCTVCLDNMRREGVGMVCKNCTVAQEEVIAYCVNASICDNTGSMPVVFFNEAMTQVLRVDCRKLVIDEEYNDPVVLPPQLIELIGQEKIFHFIFKSTETPSIQQTLDVHFTAQPEKETEILHEEVAVSNVTSSSTAPQTPASKAPRRYDRQQSGN